MFDPSSPDLWSVEEDGIGSLRDALRAIENTWGVTPELGVWGLQWLCSDPEDYDNPDA